MGLAVEAVGLGNLGNAVVAGSGNLAGAQLVEGLGASCAGSLGLANAAVVVTITGVAGQRVRLLSVDVGYFAAAPTANNPGAIITDGTTTVAMIVGQAIGGRGLTVPYGGYLFATGATVTVTANAGGAGVNAGLMVGSIVA